MQNLFPTGTSIRCRSSTNNEDLPGFNGAGLYTSKTQHPDEGHIAKSIKQVYASLWSLRAFDERDFYRVDHFLASMGVLCHPNYQDEKANGVGVSLDPLYNTENTFYLNSQVGEELITNPGSSSIPEEILLDRAAGSENDYIVIQGSNFVPSDSIILSEVYREQMRDYLNVIHDEFAKLYNAKAGDNFAMDIEYKITSSDQLIIKQARPWSSFNPQENQTPPSASTFELSVFPNPVAELMHVRCEDCDLSALTITDMLGKTLTMDVIDPSTIENLSVRVDLLPAGIYILSARRSGSEEVYTTKFVKY